jgi:hypothetical protein
MRKLYPDTLVFDNPPSKFRQIIKHIINIFVLACFISIVIKIWLNNAWIESLKELGWGFGCVIGTIFSETVADLGGYWGWTHQQWRVQPSWYVRLVSVIGIIIITYNFFFQ